MLLHKIDVLLCVCEVIDKPDCLRPMACLLQCEYLSMGLLLDLTWGIVWDYLQEQLVFGYSVLDNRSLYNLRRHTFEETVLKFSSGNVLPVE